MQAQLEGDSALRTSTVDSIHTLVSLRPGLLRGKALCGQEHLRHGSGQSMTEISPASLLCSLPAWEPCYRPLQKVWRGERNK